MPGYNHALVAVDGSAASLHAFREAARLPGLRLTAIAVAPSGQAGLAGAEGGKITPKKREPYEQALAAAARLARDAGVPLTTLLAEGEPQARIVAAAETQGCDLIIMGVTGLDALKLGMMGSTTARVIGLSRREVLVVPPQATLGFGKLLLATDGSRYSREAAARALDLVQAYGGELAVASVLDLPPGFMEETPEVAGELLERLKSLVGEVTRKAQGLALPCQEYVRLGPVYRVITDLARELKVDLIVMGSHGRTGSKRLLMGSVTERVIGFAPCPVLVVKA
ncbi:MAG: universal stress protein [Thermodesulfobacteriota bacterium]